MSAGAGAPEPDSVPPQSPVGTDHRPDWPETVGGEALEAELFEYAETQDYVKSILAARQAYRELAPRAAAGEAATLGTTR